MKRSLLFALLMAAVLFTACEKDPVDNQIDPQEELGERLFILSEGKKDANNSTLAMYTFADKKLQTDFFKDVNKGGLGDTGNDMIKYGSKIYIVMTGSGIIEVIDAQTGLSLKRIPMKTDKEVSKQPRYAAADDGKVYVTSFDNTVTRIDTTLLKSDATVEVGRNPEGICVANGKIYVANSGGLNPENLDETVSVIDQKTFKIIEEKRAIEVGQNPNLVFADSQGDVYVSTYDVYNEDWTTLITPASLKRINAATGKVETIEGVVPNRFTIANDKAYILSGYGKDAKVIVYDCITEKITNENILQGDVTFTTPYSISADPSSDDLFVTDAMHFTVLGKVVCIDKTGKYKYTIDNVGVNPKSVLYLK